jgi:hypothetical protein
MYLAGLAATGAFERQDNLIARTIENRRDDLAARRTGGARLDREFGVGLDKTPHPALGEFHRVQSRRGKTGFTVYGTYHFTSICGRQYRKGYFS